MTPGRKSSQPQQGDDTSLLIFEQHEQAHRDEQSFLGDSSLGFTGGSAYGPLIGNSVPSTSVTQPLPGAYASRNATSTGVTREQRPFGGSIGGGDDPGNHCSNASADLIISPEEMEALRGVPDIEHYKKMKMLFGDMLEPPDNIGRFMDMLEKPNANSDSELAAVIQAKKHKASCICKFAACLGWLLPCFCAKFYRVVPPDKYALISHSGYAELLLDGTHILHSCRMYYHDLPERTQQHIEYRDLHIIVIPEGKVGLMTLANEPKFLGPGRYCFFEPLLVMGEVVDMNQPVIINQTVHLISVAKGELAWGYQTGLGYPRIFSEGFHMIDNPGFKYQGKINLNAPQSKIGALTLVRVETGDVGIAYKGGKLSILQPGLHLLEPPDRFESLLCMQQTVVSLPECVHESGDYVPLRIKADVFFSISDPEKAVTMVDDIEKTIKETASATLAGIIRASTLQDIAKSSKPTHGSDPLPGPPTSVKGGNHIDASLNGLLSNSLVGQHEQHARSFYAYVHDQFIADLHDDCMRKWGIELQNIRIESLTIDDKPLSEQISKQSLIYATTQSQLANLEASRCIKETEAARDAAIEVRRSEAKKSVAELHAEGSADAMRSRAKAEAEVSTIEAHAYSTTVTLLAQGRADAAVLRATAERDGLKKLGEGQREFVKHIESVPGGPEFFIMRSQTEALEETKKVYFTGDIPQFFSPPAPQNDSSESAATGTSSSQTRALPVPAQSVPLPLLAQQAVSPSPAITAHSTTAQTQQQPSGRPSAWPKD